MNPTLYQMADSGSSIRTVLQKKTDGNYIFGISNGKNKPLICQGMPETIAEELQTRLPAYWEDIKNAEIEAKLHAATQAQLPSDGNDDEEADENFEVPDNEQVNPADALPQHNIDTLSENPDGSTTTLPELNDQPELDFGF